MNEMRERERDRSEVLTIYTTVAGFLSFLAAYDMPYSRQLIQVCVTISIQKTVTNPALCTVRSVR